MSNAKEKLETTQRTHPWLYYTDDLDMLCGVVLEMPVSKFMEVNNIKGDASVLDYMNSKQLAIFTYLQDINSSLMDSDVDFYDRCYDVTCHYLKMRSAGVI